MTDDPDRPDDPPVPTDPSDLHDAAVPLGTDRLSAWLFDLDGVLTDSATAHALAWKALFDEYLETLDPPQPPFDVHEDYLRYVDGRPRADGIRTFLASRGIVLPEASPAEDPDAPSVQRLGDSKTARFVAAVEAGAVSVYPDALTLLEWLHERGARCAVVSSSANAPMVLEHTGLSRFIEFTMDGATAARRGLPGKPAPDTFVAAAHELDADPAHAVVFEDAVVGVRAGHDGGFAAVVGVDRTGSAGPLHEGGATVVVQDLRDVIPRSPDPTSGAQ